MNCAMKLLLGLMCVGLSGAHAAEIHVAAAASLKECLNEIISCYTGQNPEVKIVPNYDASGKLQMQIENGAPADVFISADQEKMDLLDRKGLLLKDSRCNLLQNQVVLVVPATGARNVTGFADLAAADFGPRSIAIGDPKVVPAGKYAVEIFRHLNIADAVMPKTVYAPNVRAVLTFVAQGEVEAGVVYETDALLFHDDVRIAARAPEDSHTPVIYPAAVIAAGAAAAPGSEFLKFLKTPPAAAIFKKYGFQPLP